MQKGRKRRILGRTFMRGWDRVGLVWGEVLVDRRAAFPGGLYYTLL
nr:MAG TPA: hypothetical protein [Caudoviricetes sp.]